MQRYPIAFTSLVTAGLLVSASTIGQQNSQREYSETDLLDIFGQVYRATGEYYVDEVTPEQLIQGAIDGMLSQLDPHSGYEPPEQYADTREDVSGEFGGLGIQVEMEDGYVLVIAPIDDTPAAKAGIRAGDRIIELDGQTVYGLSLREAVDIMRGEIGTDIRLTVFRDSAQETFEVTITRATIPELTVRHRVLEEEIGYLRISAFTGTTMDNLNRALAALNEEFGEGELIGYLLDLRSNPGGLLPAAIDISDAFLESGEIVSIRRRGGEITGSYQAKPGDLLNGKPLVVLIDGGSASASEIVAGALQDLGRAVLVGTRSFGKGSVQTMLDLGDFGGIRLTTQRYYTPAGRSIQAVGIDPDIEVRPANVEFFEGDYFREEDYNNALANPDGVSETEEGETVGAADEVLEEEASEDDDDPLDYQLETALDVLRGIALYEALQ